MVAYIRGIDLSRYQAGPNDFGALRRAGYQFAVQRWGVGTYRDPTRVTNIDAIINAGLIPGAYLVPGRNTGSGMEQARRFIAEVRQAFGPNEPMLFTLDGEHSVAWGDPTAQQCIDFAATLHADTGRMALGYVPRWWMQQQGWTTAQVEAISRHAVWWASQYPARPALDTPPAPYKGWVPKLWQWTSSGEVPGIPGRVDLNVFYGTRDELLALAANPSTLPAPTQEGVEMVIVQNTEDPAKGAALGVIGDQTLLITSTRNLENFRSRGIPVVPVDRNQFSRFEKLRVDVDDAADG